MIREDVMRYTLKDCRSAGLFCWILLLGAMICVSLVPGSGRAPGESIYLDKIFHFVTSSVATALPLIFIYRRRTAFVCAALIPVLGFVLEYLQRNVNGRTFSPEDLLANNFGVVIGVAVGCCVRLVRRYKRRGEKR